MARFTHPIPEEEQVYRKWAAFQPAQIRELADQFEPWSLYRLKSTGHRVTVLSFSENGTLKVAVAGHFNLIDRDRIVSGIAPDDLESCDLPCPDEKVGTLADGERFTLLPGRPTGP